MPSNNSAPRTVSCVSAGGEVDTDGRLGTGALSDRMQRRSSSFEALVAAAETKQQQAERRAAVHLYDEAIALFQQALERTGEADGSATRDEVENVTILLAEALQNKCELFLKLWEAEGQRQGADPLGLLGEYSAEHEAAVFDQARGMLRASTMLYKSSGTPTNRCDQGLSGLRVDALVNLGNTLSLWATVAVDPAEIDGIHVEAVAAYDQALLIEDDATTRNNKGDTLIAYAEYLAEQCRADDAERAFEAALLAYESAVQLSDSQKGDNLPMLLLDYGSAFLSLAEFCFKVRDDRERALRLLTEAEKRLTYSESFGRGCAGVHNALGEIHLLVGEISGDVLALDAASGAFGRALQVQRTDVNGLVGTAETAVEKAKRAGSAAEASQLYAKAAESYRAAFASNKFSGTLKDKSNTLYNYACCLSAMGAKEEAKRIVGGLLAKGLVTEAEVSADADLSNAS